MTPQELKNSILQRAIQGKLVEQRTEEGTAEELYQQIQQEKQRLIKEKKIKKEKPLPEITEDEVPFDIPESWKWVRLGSVINLLSGTDFKPEEYNDVGKGTVYITGASCLSDNGVLACRWTETPRIISEYGDVLLVCKGSGYGKTAICDVPKAHIARQIMAIKQSSCLSMSYVRYFILANLTHIKKNGQGVIPGIDRGSVLNMFFPLPPLAEQHRIVAIIEELLPLIDRYEKAWSRLEDFNKRFPLDMQKSILQTAIQGKLVEQREDEGTGEELYQQIQAEKQRLIKEKKIKKGKPLSEITEDEVPFDVPESWKWVRLEELAREKPANGFSPKGVSYQTDVRNLTLSATTSGYFKPDAFKYVDVKIEDDSKYWLKHNDLLIQRSNSRELVGTSCIYTGLDNAFIYPDLMMRIQLFDFVDVRYIDFVLKSPLTRSYYSKSASGTSESMPKINQGIVSNTLIPLPPFAEQKRIVAKLEEMLPLCERLK